MAHEGGIGDQPIQEEYRAWLKAVAQTIDELLNGDPKTRVGEKQHGFIVMMFPFDELGSEGKGRVNYISNANREDVLVMLKEQIAHFEGRHLPDGKA